LQHLTRHSLTLQRKNALFAGHDLGAENWATFATLIETCKLGGINPHAISPTSSSGSCYAAMQIPSMTCCPKPGPPTESPKKGDQSGRLTKPRGGAIALTIMQRLMRAQHSGERFAGYELDRLVPLALGWAPADESNLWLELWTGPMNAGDKDAVEFVLWRLVC